MCGIFCLLHPGAETMIYDDRLGRLQRRGPDGYVRLAKRKLTPNVSAEVHGCILHLRGVKTIQQPLMTSARADDNLLKSSFFLWNGEVFDGVHVAIDANDTEIMFHALEEATCDPSSILSLMSKVHGPWAFVYWQAESNRLWFGRDMFGRRSLLWTRTDTIFALSSVINRPTIQAINDSSATLMRDPQVWEEVPACGIFCIDLSRSNKESPTNYFDSIQCYTWNAGGLLAPVTESFCKAIPVNDLGLIYNGINKTNSSTPSAIFEELLRVDSFRVQVCQLDALLSSAVKRRVDNQMAPTSYCKICTRDETSKHRCVSHAKIAVLFSGGLDSTVLCALADRFVLVDEPIDLLNVAFEMSRAKRACFNTAAAYDVPDRISGRKALEELRRIAPKRQWNFVEINISKEEMETESESQIADVVYPLTTVLDNDLGCAVWFATRGKGQVLVNGKYVDYTSPSKVVLTGIGADEQLGGYSRHRVCYVRGGWPALIAEINMEMGRISQRNLGRDDRVIADHGREGRFPFLDEHVVNYLNSLPIWFKVNLDLPRGVGDKVLLRTLAFNLGLETTSSLEKRALQFGSKISKMERGRNGADTCSRLLAKIK